MAPKLSTLVDPFTAGSINTAVWNGSTAGVYALDTVNDLVTLNVGTAANTFWNFGAGSYDATGSSLYAQITAPPVGNGGASISLKLDAGSSNSVSIRAKSGGSFVLNLTTAGTTVATPLPAYDPHAHRWWQISESGGAFTFATSPDGYNWTSLASASYAWNATAVAVYFQTSTGASAEPSGMVATISNVNTMLGGLANPNWPVVEDAWGPMWNANGGAIPSDRYVSVTDRTRGNVGVTRGRQYETDQVRSGEASLTLANPDGALDPGNATGPWAGHVLPYQPYKRRAQWPPTRNLLTQALATGGDVGGYSTGVIPDSVGLYSVTDSTGGSIISSGSAYRGSTVFQFTVPANQGIYSPICYTRQVAVTPGQRYTQQFYVRNVTPATSQIVYGYTHFSTLNSSDTEASSGFVTLAGSATAGWTRITVTGTAPSNAAYMSLGISTGAANGATAESIQVDGWQLEKGSVASTWACPGLWSPIYAGFTERWPSSWNMSGTYGVVQPTGVDSFSLLSQQQLRDALTQETSNNSPRFFFKLDDPAGSTSAADATGTYPAAPLAISKYGAGTVTFGNAVTAASATGTFTGSTGTVMTVNNPNPGSVILSAATYLKLSASGIKGPANPALWTRMIAFRYTGPTPTDNAFIWSSMDNQRAGVGTGAFLHFVITTAGSLQLWMSGPGGTSVAFNTGSTNVVDSNWHLFAAAYNQTAQTMLLMIDGVAYSYASVNTALTPAGLDSDSIGSRVDVTVGGSTNDNFKGDIAFVGEFPAALNSTAMGNLYTAWRSACSGESTAARYARILRYSGYTGPTSLQAGLTTSMGPANISGQDAVSALQAVVETEGGAHYVSRDGTITFRSRSTRYNAFTPVYTFGERADLGEWPYEDAQLDFDSTHLSNTVTVTQEGTSQQFYAQDATSTTAYFPRTMTRTINSNSALECQDAANYLLSRYKNPATRVSGIKLHPSANPAMWPVCLALELGTRVRVMRRPPAAPATQVDCFVENIQADFGDNGEAWYTLQCSPVDLTPYAVFAAWHTTLNVSVAAGVTTITVNASADNTNPLATQLARGQQIVLGQNTANQETVTVDSVGATSPGWATAVITLTAATTKAHTSGDLVNEPLPPGVTDPTTFDASSKFDSTAFAY